MLLQQALNLIADWAEIVREDYKPVALLYACLELHPSWTETRATATSSATVSRAAVTPSTTAEVSPAAPTAPPAGR